ncbi:CACTA en-spm transposon protein [Cucumis melo var. makuwa]|uniref:CACTA en-spm transposon protein n=1 Tax=Cucumis melo var. makuwa TaxID=1194695 RepID=A0A5D3BNU3_CUCMM|nr:CACTA en-spm transposon protein [Cucumis melo var. makuwa]TYK00894.1 CACTA en-spm transposon protein [Cucumis melo var. makuwa]
MLTVWKELMGQNHRHFKKFNNREQAHANLPSRLRNQEQSSMNKATRAKQFYNHSSGFKSFLQRQHDTLLAVLRLHLSSKS